jgi:hypothetical protein
MKGISSQREEPEAENRAGYTSTEQTTENIKTQQGIRANYPLHLIRLSLETTIINRKRRKKKHPLVNDERSPELRTRRDRGTIISI